MSIYILNRILCTKSGISIFVTKENKICKYLWGVNVDSSFLVDSINSETEFIWFQSPNSYKLFNQFQNDFPGVEEHRQIKIKFLSILIKED